MIKNLLISNKDKKAIERILKTLNISIDEFMEINNLSSIKDEIESLKKELNAKECLIKELNDKLEQNNAIVNDLVKEVNKMTAEFTNLVRDTFMGGE